MEVTFTMRGEEDLDRRGVNASVWDGRQSITDTQEGDGSEIVLIVSTTPYTLTANISSKSALLCSVGLKGSLGYTLTCSVRKEDMPTAALFTRTYTVQQDRNVPDQYHSI